jgi:hypothetical protein
MTSILKADTIQDTDGNNIINESGNTITIGASGDTTNIVGTLQNNGASVGGVMTPAFSVSKSSQTTGQADATWTKITYDTELLDSDGTFASDKFTPAVAGKYFITVSATMGTSNASSLEASSVGIYKNGSQITGASNNSKTENEVELADHTASCIIDLDTDDYIEGYVYINKSTGTNRITTSQLTGFKIIGA